MTGNPHTNEPEAGGRPLTAYLLGCLDFDTLLGLQRRLVYDAGGDRPTAAVVLCDHPMGITIGREGSRLHVRPSPEELQARRWPVRWVSRGGGTLLHAAGQVACYPVLPIDILGLTPAAYVARLEEVALALLAEYGVCGQKDPARPGVLVNGRRVVHIGVAFRGRVACFGMVVNADPDLEPFREVRCDGDRLPMTSLARESPFRVRVTGVRQRLLELLAARFGFARVSVFHTPPGMLPARPRHVTAHRH